MSLHSIDDEAKKRRRDACITAPHGSVSPDLGIVLATRLTKADIGNVQIVQRHVEVTCPHELVLRSGMKWLRSTGISIGCARSMICYLGARGVLVGLLAALEALGLAIHLTRLSLRAMFGSAGELTRPAGCSETQHDWCFGIPQQLSQGSSTHSLTHRSTRAACPLLLPNVIASLSHTLRRSCMSQSSPLLGTYVLSTMKSGSLDDTCVALATNEANTNQPTPRMCRAPLDGVSSSRVLLCTFLSASFSFSGAGLRIRRPRKPAAQ
jgi:hypothetical protein